MKKRNIIISVLALVFFGILILVISNKTGEFDNYIHNIVTNNINDRLTKFWKCITFLGSTKFIISMCVILLGVFIVVKKKWYGIILGCSLISSTIVNNVVKVLVCRERPIMNVMVIEKTFSFPSGHAMASTMLYGMLSYYVFKSNMNKYLKIVYMSLLYTLIILVCTSRIYLGAHFVTDILAGVVLSTTLILIIISYIEKRNKLQ